MMINQLLQGWKAASDSKMSSQRLDVQRLHPEDPGSSRSEAGSGALWAALQITVSGKKI
ncbi:MAG: hypothetical protein KJZ93_15345 [Caldilineaceae bacterium]|nr:hypothetical protein [Caldilineaceae bacterium]